MSLMSLLRNRIATPAPQHRREAARMRPQLETLEDRLVPSTLTVTSTADSGAGTLRADIAAAKSGDSIVFAPSLDGKTITLTSGELNITKGVTIQGPGAGLLTVSGNNQSRVFEVNASQPVVLSGLNIVSGNGGLDGGAIYNHTALTISTCTITGSTANYGGGIFNLGTLAVNDSVLASNSAAYYGGGIYNNGTLTLSDSTLCYNHASSNGGGIEDLAYSSKLSASGCTLHDNIARDSGGGMWLNGTATLTNCTLSSNHSYGNDDPWGGSPPSGGGGLFVYYGSTTLTNCTLSLNSAYAFGGGIDVNRGSTLNLINTIVAGNTAGRGPDLSNIYGAVVTFDHDLVGGNAELGPLQNNGGPTETMALLPGSPAIGQGDNSKAPATDQRGITRLDESGETTDIGAFEL